MTQWSENYVSADFGELQANAMAVDCIGKWAVLAGRRVLMLVDLDEPIEKCHRIIRQNHTKFDISCVQWNPNASHAHHFCTACTQKLDLYSWEDGCSKPICSMKAHSRNIGAIDWSPFDVNVIASCSVDTYTHLWDVRDPKRPTASFQSVCGATQVQWNKVTNNLFATAHEGDVRIWDPRNGNTPVMYLTAHLAKIHGIDWNPHSERVFATSSQDCTVKFWDYTNARSDKGMLNSGSPVWKARYTPFGDGMVTIVSATLRRGENNLFLWNNNKLDQPVHQFVGHNDVVLEFQWRKQSEDSREHNLVTWSKDQCLKIWKVDHQLQRLCGHDAVDSENESPVSGSGAAPGDSVYDMHSPPPPPPSSGSNTPGRGASGDRQTQQLMSLSQEFSLLNKYIPNVTIEKMDESERQCTICLGSNKNSVNGSISFPHNYPNAEPNFTITMYNGVGTSVIKELYKVFRETSQMHVKRNINCLEPCIRKLATAFDSMNIEERKTPDSDACPPPPSKLQHPPLMALSSAAFQDYSIPFPRTCGAKFNSAGLLVCFWRSREANKSKGLEKTPKALSDLAAYTSTNRNVRSSHNTTGFTSLFSRSPPTPKAEHISISNYYMPPKRQRTKSRTFKEMRKEKKPVKLDPVRIYDTQSLLHVHRHLGQNYRLDTTDLLGMCNHNVKEAAAVGRRDLVQMWSMLKLVSSPSLEPSPDPDAGIPWGKIPFGRKMLESLLEYYQGVRDVQTLAMLCCIFWNKQYVMSSPSHTLVKSPSRNSLDYVMPPNYNPYHTVSSMSGLLRSFTKKLQESAQQENGDTTELSSTTSPPKREASSPSMPYIFTRAMVKVRRSNSNPDISFEDYKFADETDPREKAEELEKKQHEKMCRLLDPTKYPLYDHFLKVYADILHRWGLRNQAAHVLKHVTVPPEPHSGIEFGVNCHFCNSEVRGVKCDTCKMRAFQCVICHKGVKGTSNFCLSCGHGGHASHMRDWFKTEEECPAGCGCQCLKWSPF